MLIKQLDHNTIDVFIGTGWDFWGRFKIAHKKNGIQLFQIKGTRFPKKEEEVLHNYYN